MQLDDHIRQALADEADSFPMDAVTRLRRIDYKPAQLCDPAAARRRPRRGRRRGRRDAHRGGKRGHPGGVCRLARRALRTPPLLARRRSRTYAAPGSGGPRRPAPRPAHPRLRTRVAHTRLSSTPGHLLCWTRVLSGLHGFVAAGWNRDQHWLRGRSAIHRSPPAPPLRCRPR